MASYSYDDGFSGSGTKDRLEELLSKARAEDEEKLRRRREESTSPNHQNRYLKWIQYAVYLWVGRLAFIMIGSIFPLFAAIANLEGDIVKPNYLPIIPRLSWQLIQNDNSGKDRNKLSEINTYRSQFQPFLITGLPTLSNNTIKLFLSALFQSNTISMKASSSAEFRYYTHDRLWSEINEYKQNPKVLSYRYISLEEYFNLGDQLETQLSFPKHQYLDFLESLPSIVAKRRANSKSTTDTAVEHASRKASKTQQSYVYVAYPDIVSHLESFAPPLSTISQAISTKQPQANLWISSEGVIAKMHYDIQDNFLFQLTGSKRVTLLSPEAGRLFRPYPSLHPLWRQTSRTNLTYDQLVTSFLEQNQSKPQPPDSQSEKGEASEAGQGRRRGKEINIIKSESFMLWTVDLHVGDLLYIPAGYYHEVETGADSISINTWFPSSYSTFTHRLSKVSLPFVNSDNIDMKLAKVAIIMKEICHLVGEKRSCLVDRMRERYESVFADQEQYYKQLETNSGVSRQQECLASDALMCNPVSTMKTADLYHLNQRVAGEIVRMKENSKLTYDLFILAIVEFFEDILQTMVFNLPSSSPSLSKSQSLTDSSVVENEGKRKGLTSCVMQVILEHCWVYDYLPTY